MLLGSRAGCLWKVSETFKRSLLNLQSGGYTLGGQSSWVLLLQGELAALSSLSWVPVEEIREGRQN